MYLVLLQLFALRLLLLELFNLPQFLVRRWNRHKHGSCYNIIIHYNVIVAKLDSTNMVLEYKIQNIINKLSLFWIYYVNKYKIKIVNFIIISQKTGRSGWELKIKSNLPKILEFLLPISTTTSTSTLLTGPAHQVCCHGHGISLLLTPPPSLRVLLFAALLLLLLASAALSRL